MAECKDHDRHMCMLVAKRVPLDQLKPLVKDAKYICKNCARATNDPKNVCAPEAL